MTEGDPNNLICGITIDVTPLYPDLSAKALYRSLLWENGEMHDSFRSILEKGSIKSLTRLIQERFTSPSYLRVCAEATAYEWIDEGDEEESFSVEIDVFGHGCLYDPISKIVADFNTGEAVCEELRPMLTAYTARGELILQWKLETVEYGEQ